MAQKQNDPALMMGACQALASTLYFSGDFEAARRHAERGVLLKAPAIPGLTECLTGLRPAEWRTLGGSSPVEEVIAPVVVCLCYEALTEWHFGELVSSKTTMAEAIALAKERDDSHALGEALFFSGILAHCACNPVEVERLALNLIELSARQNFAFWLAGGTILRGWARSASGAVEAISEIEGGIRDYRATGSTLGVPFGLALKAEALHLADRTAEALSAINEAETLIDRFGERWWRADCNAQTQVSSLEFYDGRGTSSDRQMPRTVIVVYFSVAGNSGSLSISRIPPHGMLPAFAIKLAAVR